MRILSVNQYVATVYDMLLVSKCHISIRRMFNYTCHVTLYDCALFEITGADPTCRPIYTMLLIKILQKLRVCGFLFFCLLFF